MLFSYVLICIICAYMSIDILSGLSVKSHMRAHGVVYETARSDLLGLTRKAVPLLIPPEVVAYNRQLISS